MDTLLKIKIKIKMCKTPTLFSQKNKNRKMACHNK